jgi:hypothetical protein
LSAVLHFEPLVANAQLSKSSASYFCNDVYKAGMESARRQGRIGGRPRKLRPQEQAEIITMVSRGKKRLLMPLAFSACIGRRFHAS